MLKALYYSFKCSVIVRGSLRLALGNQNPGHRILVWLRDKYRLTDVYMYLYNKTDNKIKAKLRNIISKLYIFLNYTIIDIMVQPKF